MSRKCLGNDFKKRYFFSRWQNVDSDSDSDEVVLLLLMVVVIGTTVFQKPDAAVVNDENLNLMYLSVVLILCHSHVCTLCLKKKGPRHYRL